MRYSLLAFFALVTFASPAIAGEIENQFFSMDRNRDGQISRDEFVTNQIANGKSERSANFAFDNFRGTDQRITLTEFRNGPVASLNAGEDIRRAVRRPNRRSSEARERRSQPAPRRSSGGFGS
ncbi:MAG: hypothetical protein AAF950_09110 [Pseudomonadota bacterium]